MAWIPSYQITQQVLQKKRKRKGYNLADYQNHYLIFFSFLNYESITITGDLENTEQRLHMVPLYIKLFFK